MNKKFEKEVLRLLPDYSVFEHIFFKPPVNHIISGFSWERPPSGLYIWKTAFPLYDHMEFIHNGYGDRLPRPDDRMLVAKGQERAAAEEFVGRISPYQQSMDKLSDIDEFYEYLGCRSLDNPIIRRGYALTSIMVGREDEALHQLKLCLEGPTDMKIKSDIEGTIENLLSGTARQKLAIWNNHLL